jgi:branched-subunit amino acid transport protein
MNDLAIWATMFAMALVTLMSRLSFIAAWGRITLPEGLREALRFVPPAVLAAIILPALVIRDGQLNLSPDNDRLIAGLVATMIAWRTRNALATIVVGMVTLFLIGMLR